MGQKANQVDAVAHIRILTTMVQTCHQLEMVNILTFKKPLWEHLLGTSIDKILSTKQNNYNRNE